MTLIELGFVVFIVVVGGFFGIISGQHFGWPGYLVGFLVGAFACWVVLWFLFNGLGYLEQIAYRGRPTRPDCRNGKCRWFDYRLHDEQGQYVWACRCGGRYRKDGRHFYEVLPDGSSKPYMVWRPFRGWFPESFDPLQETKS